MSQGLPERESSEEWIHRHAWDCDEVTISAAGAGGQQNLGVAVGAGRIRRITELRIRHAGTNNTVVTLLISGGATKHSIDVPPQTTRVYYIGKVGAVFDAGEQPACQSSDVTGGNTYVGAAGVEG